MSDRIKACRHTAGHHQEAGARNAAGVTEISPRSGEVSPVNPPDPAPCAGPGEPSVSGVTAETVPTVSGQPWPSPETLAAMSVPALAAAINTGHTDIQAAAHTARQHAANALTGALRTGALLAESHRRQNKGWGAWVREHCPRLPISTAYRYMDLARKFPHVRKGQEIAGLRQAYVAVGIIPEPAAKKKKAPDLDHVPPATGTDLVARIKSNHDFLGTEFEKVDPAALSDADRRALLAEINALIERLTAVRQSISRAEPAVNEATAGAKEAA